LQLHIDLTGSSQAYLASIDDPTKAALDRFGAPGGHQQDAHELLIFLLARLEDELNPARNGTIEGNVPSDKADEWAKQQLSIEAASQLARDFLFTNRASPLHRSLDIVQFEILTCRTCRHTGRKWGIANHLLVSVDGFREKGSPDLQSYLENVYGTEDPLPLDGFRCPNKDCGRVGTTHNTSYISHFPDYLIISLGRYRSNRYDANDSQKVGDIVRFGESFDLSRCFAPVTIQPSAQRPQTPPFKYQVCAVVRHAGNTLKSGHYTAIARHLDQPLNIGNTPAAGTWHVYNDRVVRPLNQLVSPDNRLYHNAAIIFLKRESAPLTTSF
jgi:ubiquitin carboxyl-terminal hydrolase 8